MKKTILILFLTIEFGANAQRIFDVHLHGDKEPEKQLTHLLSKGVYKVAVSTSWVLQQKYNGNEDVSVVQGLMLPCPQGKVPYSLQDCYADQNEFPDLGWVENLIKENKIQFIGEVLTQYYGISPSDPKMKAYYKLAEKYGIPVGIHFGLAGPGHGSPNFKVSLGNPMSLEETLREFPNLKIWIMHSGAPFIEDTIAIMKYYDNVYMDISALNNPYIFPEAEFHFVMKRFIDSGLGDRMMFGSDNGPIDQIIANINNIPFLDQNQKEGIFYKNAETFFKR
jgi:hypothetical protein